MSEPSLAAVLADPDPAVRASGLSRVRFRDLKDPALLRSVLRLCRDPAEIPGAAATVEDPFAAFFGRAGPAFATVADAAAKRLAETGLPDDPGAAAILAEAVAADGPPGRLPRVAAKALGETRWQDLGGAVRAIVPALDRWDEPLFEAIARLPEDGWTILAELAASPLRPRLLQELLNHAPAHELAVTAVEEAIGTGRLVPDASAAATVLSVLASWSEPAGARIARVLEPRFPWIVAWRAVDDPASRPALAAWLAEGAPGAPAGLLARVAEVLRQRDAPAGFPTAAFLRVLDDEAGLAEAWGADPAVAAEVAELLQRWVRAGHPARSAAAKVLLAAGLHGPVEAELSAAIGEAWDADLLEALANAGVPGVLDAVLARLAAEPDEVGVAAGALVALGPSACRAAAEQVLARAEAAPIDRERVGRDTVRERRRGVDVEALAPVVAAVGDPALAARLEQVMPVVRAG